MYTTTVGRTFLRTYNRQFNKDYSAKSFFEEVFVPLFFDHPKYMMTAGNSPLENPKLSWDDMIKGEKAFETPDQRKNRINKMIQKIENEKADASIAVGYGVLDQSAATSGQITNIDIPNNKEDIYLSWIGAGLGIGVVGGITILFDKPELLMDVFEGWKYYRQYLENNPLLKGNQINTWNGQWISYRYGFAFDKDDPTAGLNPMEKTNNDLFNIPTIIWVKVLLGIAKHFQGVNLVGYLYNIGQTNSTIGFIPFKLDEITRPNLFYEKIFGKEAFMRNIKQIEELYGTAFGIRVACQYGSIGVAALEPKGLKSYMPSAKGGGKTSLKKNDNTKIIIFNTYLIWILAMLNNDELWNQSQQIAKLLWAYEAEAEKLRTNRTNNVKQLLDSTSAKVFLQNLIPIVEDEVKAGKDVILYNELGKMINSLPSYNFPYFNTLIKFQYALINK